MRQPERLPESVAGADLATFLADPLTHRDRAIVLAMVLEGCAQERSVASR